MNELKHHRFKEDGTTLALFEDEGKYSLSLFDKNDIEIWTMEYFHREDAYTEFNKRVAEGPIDKRSGAKR